MLTQLHLKNWRSLRDVTIDFAPITVFIGANSSGKTNIVEGLEYLLRSYLIDDSEILFDLTKPEIKHRNVESDESIELSLTGSAYDLNPSKNWLYKLLWSKQENFTKLKKSLSRPNSMPSSIFKIAAESGFFDFYKEEIPEFDIIATRHWQFLGENFYPRLVLLTEEEHSVFYLKRNAENTLRALEFMQQRYPEIYQQLQDELQWLLSHIESIEPIGDEQKTRLAIREPAFTAEAPTISAGTARMVAMLTAIHALDMVIIEEPDTALNPGLLAKFVELVRGYAENTKRPRQFIFTTHNPTFLNLFKPEEVRVVSRDEQGVTTVNSIPDYIAKIWLEKGEYQLGDVWQTNAFGGLAE
jgi:AAA15 family ATPase/GTPase